MLLEFLPDFLNPKTLYFGLLLLLIGYKIGRWKAVREYDALNTALGSLLPVANPSVRLEWIPVDREATRGNDTEPRLYVVAVIVAFPDDHGAVSGGPPGLRIIDKEVPNV